MPAEGVARTGPRQRPARTFALLAIVLVAAGYVAQRVWISALVTAAEQAARRGDWAETIRVLERVRRYGGLDAQLRGLGFRAALKREDPVMAERYLRSAAEPQGDEVLQCADLYLRRDHVEDALRVLNRSIHFEANTWRRAARRCVMIYGVLRDENRQRHKLGVLVRQGTPSDARWAAGLLAQGEAVIPGDEVPPGFDELATLERVVRVDPDWSRPKVALAHALRSRGRLDEALALLGDVVTREPGFSDARVEEIACRLEAGEEGPVVALLDAPSAELAGDPDFQALRGAWHDANDRPSEAIAGYRESLRLRPGHPATLYRLSRALESSGRSEDARREQRRFEVAKAYRRAALGPDAADGLGALARMADELGRDEDAERWRSLARSEAPAGRTRRGP